MLRGGEVACRWVWLLLLAVVAAAVADPPVCWHTAATRLQSLLLSSTHQSRPLSLVGCRGTYAELAAAGIPVRYTHRQSGAVQWQYNAWLQQQCGEAPGPAWREALYVAGGLSRKLNAERYRDTPLPGAEAAEQAAREDAARVRQQRAESAAAAAAVVSAAV